MVSVREHVKGIIVKYLCKRVAESFSCCRAETGKGTVTLTNKATLQTVTQLDRYLGSYVLGGQVLL